MLWQPPLIAKKAEVMTGNTCPVRAADVIDALDEGLIAGAALDVLTAEPPMDDHIIMQNLHRPNLLVTPHVAWASEEAMQGLWDQLVGHIDHFIKGTPRNCL